MEMKRGTETRLLLCALTPQEIAERAKRHVETCERIAKKKAEKKRAIKVLTREIEEIEEMEIVLREAHQTGKEEREVECVEVLCSITQKKRWVRTDTMETIGTPKDLDLIDLSDIKQEEEKETAKKLSMH